MQMQIKQIRTFQLSIPIRPCQLGLIFLKANLGSLVKDVILIAELHFIELACTHIRLVEEFPAYANLDDYLEFLLSQHL